MSNNSFFNAAPPPGLVPPAAPQYAAPVPVQYAQPQYAAPQVYAQPPAQPALVFNPHDAEGVANLIGGPPVNPGAHVVKLKQSAHGDYTLKIVNASTFKGYRIGAAFAVDFEVSGPLGPLGVRSHLFPLTGPGDQQRYRADDITSFLVACGVPLESTNGAFRELMGNPLVLNNRVLRGSVMPGRNPQYNEVKFSKA